MYARIVVETWRPLLAQLRRNGAAAEYEEMKAGESDVS
jgi:hypothetical protein